MCGSFLVNNDVIPALNNFQPCPWIQGQFEFGDVYPSQLSPIIVFNSNTQEYEVKLLPFGFSDVIYGKKTDIINARSETVQEKRMFRKGVETDRAIVVCSGFYEWHDHRERYLFTTGHTLYLAAIIVRDSFVILTKAANSSVAPVHPRMPVIFDENEAKEWLTQPDLVGALIDASSPVLNATPTSQPTSEQLSLF
ncbi:MAG: SOS response-associated peptidase family protein [Allobaculum sp.]